MSYEKSKSNWFNKIEEFKDFLKRNNKPTSLTKEGRKWYNWMNNQKIHYHKNKYNLKHEENRKIWEDLCESFHLNNKYKVEKNIKPKKKKKDFETILNSVTKIIEENNNIIPTSKSNNKYVYNWLRTQKKNYHNLSYVFMKEENRKLWENFCLKFNIKTTKIERKSFLSSCLEFQKFMENRNGELPKCDEKKWYNWLMLQKNKYRNNNFKKENELFQWKEIMSMYNIPDVPFKKNQSFNTYEEKCNLYRDFLKKKNITFPNRKTIDEEEKYWYGWVTNQRYNYENRKFRLDKDIYRKEWEKLLNEKIVI